MFHFENWVYANEEHIKLSHPQDIFDDLIILNYKNKHAKQELIKIIKIDFLKLEIYQLSNIFEKIIRLKNIEVKDINNNKSNSLYDPYFRYSFDFKIHDIPLMVQNPFNLKTANYDIEDKERINEFKIKFQKPVKFIECIYSALGTENIRIVVLEALEDIDPNDYMVVVCGTKNDILVRVDKHKIIVNKEYLLTQMNPYWKL